MRWIMEQKAKDYELILKQLGVLDIDSPLINRFDEVDGKYLEEFVEILNRHCQWD